MRRTTWRQLSERRSPLPQGAVPTGVRPPLRRRKVRSTPFPPAAKTAPAPLLLLYPPRGARRGPLLVAPKRECAAPGGREKGAWRAPVQWPSARDGGRRIGACSDLSWPSGTLFSSARSILPSRGGWFRRRRGGYRIEQLLFSLPLAVPRRSYCNGPMRASAPTGTRKAIVLP